MLAVTRPRRHGRRSWVGRGLFYILVLVILLFIVFPFYWALRSAITPDRDLFATPVQYFPTNPTFSNFAQVLGDGYFLRAIVNSILVAALVTIIALAIGSSAAYALGRLHFVGRTPVLYLILSMTMFPQIAVLGALWNMINQFGLYDHIYALILTYLMLAVPLTVWILTFFFKSMPADLEEAAYIDGATPFQTYWKIMVPMAAPAFATTGVLALISAWNEFLFAVSFVQSPESRTVTVAIFYFQPSANVGDFIITPWGQEMAATVLVTAPLIAFIFILHRYILASLTGGAIKG